VLLSVRSEAAFGSVTAFGQSAATYNAEGGTVFDIAAPTTIPS